MDKILTSLEREYVVSRGQETGHLLYHLYKRMSIDDDRYLDLKANLGYIYEIADLPSPTMNQRKAFVEYVASARSWYKHLNPVIETSFYFYLNPTIMMEYPKYGKPTMNNNENTFHYSTMTTKKYRDLFGYLTYFQVYEGQVAEEMIGVKCENGKDIPVPKEFFEKSKAGLTSDIHGATFLDGPYYNDRRVETDEEMQLRKESNKRHHEAFQSMHPERYKKQMSELNSMLEGVNKFIEFFEQEKAKIG